MTKGGNYMKKLEGNPLLMHLSLPAAHTLDLLGKQSVRATFKSSRNCIDMIDIVSAQLNIKKKSLFDHLAEDIESLKTIAQRVANGGENKKTASRKPMSSAENP